MNNTQSGYLHIPTIPRDFIGQMTNHLNTETCLSHDLQERLSEVQSRTKISISEYVSLFKSLAHDLEDEMLGFLPRPVPQGSFAALCHLLYHSPNLITALENYNRFYSLFLRSGESLLDLSHLREQRRIRLNRVSKQSENPMFEQTIIMALLKMTTWLTGKRVSLDRLQFTFEAMPFDGEFSYLYGTTPHFGGDTASLQYSERVLEHPIQPSEGADSFGHHYVEHLLYWSMKDDITREVYAEIAHRLISGDYDVVSVAKAMGISKHTLSRRLKSRGTSYSEILARVRKGKALYLLLNSSASIESISERLGFREFGSFSRAFKGWTSLSPSQYREQRSGATNG